MTDPEPSAEIVPAAQAILPMGIDQAEQAMRLYQQITRRLLITEDWQGPPGAEGSFVKRRGWSKLATFYGLSTEIVSGGVDRDQDGNAIRARFVVRATHPNGRHEEGDGACSITEPRFATVRGRLKAEHDLAATARTRARNRAIADLIGFGEVSAEEVDGSTEPNRPYGPMATAKQADRAGDAIRAVHGPDYDSDDLLVRIATDADGYLPQIVARALTRMAAHRPGRAGAQTGAATTSGNPGQDATSAGSPDAGDHAEQDAAPVGGTDDAAP